MSIERNESIRFHERGTLEAVTRWIARHDDGIAEWLKNVRRQYQIDRANVAAEHRVAVLLLQDEKDGQPARVGVLDVGGATLEDVTAWSTWQDPDASRRGSQLDEEDTQGNGGKAYMYRLFTGPARILGVRDRRRNSKGFEGDGSTVVRGTPGWMPNVAGGRDVEISSFDAELRHALSPYGIAVGALPEPARIALGARQSFTLVEGERPSLLYRGRIDAEDLIARIVRHEQSTLCLEQVDVFAVHNGQLIDQGKPLRLPAIPPYPGLEMPIITEIPDNLPLENGQAVSTTDDGVRPRGRLTLHTSAENMPAAWRNLRHRWQIIYRTRHQMIGAKRVEEIAGPTPGAQYIYGSVELAALEPAYVEHGRRRPKPGPLVEALDRFTAERIKDVAQQISSRREQKLDEKALDEVHQENRQLDQLKNSFLPSPTAGSGNGGAGDPSQSPPPPPAEWGQVPDALEYTKPETGIDIAKTISIPLRALLRPKVRDQKGRPVRATLEWFSSDKRIASVSRVGSLEAREKGSCEIWFKVKGTDIVSDRVPVRVRSIDHVLLTPRVVDIPLGTRQRIIAEVTDDDGQRSTDVLLDWKHDAEDQLVVRINRDGVVTANRMGRTAITAGAGGVWARIPVEANVLANPEKPRDPGGFPRLLLTGRDLDPATGTIRLGDPDQPPLWQEVTDYLQNVWWLNLQSAEAACAFKQWPVDPVVWRTYHAEKLVDMVVQVWMREEFTRSGTERQDFWAAHRTALDRHRVRVLQAMWKHLEPYVLTGAVSALADE